VIDQIYQGGALYRVEMPATLPPRLEVPRPHFELPPRSSPRRTVRRLVLKLFESASPEQLEEPVSPPAPAARRPGRGAAPRLENSPSPNVESRTSNVETPPAEPATDDRPSTLDLRPLAAYLRPAEVAAASPRIEVHGHWDGDVRSEAAASAASLVVLPEPADLQLTEPAPLVELRLESLPVPSSLSSPLAPRAEGEPREPDASSGSFRVDPPHAEAPGRPHAKFAPAQEETDTAEQKGAAENSLDFAEESSEEARAGEPDRPFADLDPAAAAATIAAAAERDEGRCIPVWEVDRFQWPVAVERLVAAKGGYFGEAGERLVAAVHDGLKVLAVTGSRRGEGRTTLALCLARAAAKSGIEVAVVDADFARPQLAARIGLEISHGWQDAATGLIPLSEAAVRSLADEMTVLPLEAASAAGQLSLADPRVTATLRAAAATFELVIVDLGPLAAADESLFPADEACPFDAAIVVRDLRWASSAESESVGERLYSAGVEAVGVAENFAPAAEGTSA
jgi:Mrp family chromosome partitioning ATPase